MQEKDTHNSEAVDKRAPMAAAPMRYREDGEVDWGNMWDSFCVLAREGGPPHRDTLLRAQENADVENSGYRNAAREITRGIYEVAGLRAENATPGWLSVQCRSEAQAQWLAEAIVEENVQAQHEGNVLFVPVGDYFTQKGEIKNVITAVAKTTHYWKDHVPVDEKAQLGEKVEKPNWRQRLAAWMGT